MGLFEKIVNLITYKKTKARLEQEKLEKERIEKEKLEQERLERKKIRLERLEQKKLEQEKLEMEEKNTISHTNEKLKENYMANWILNPDFFKRDLNDDLYKRMLCERCGTPLYNNTSDGTLTCGNCGQKYSYYCNNCYTYTSDSYCTNCGEDTIFRIVYEEDDEEDDDDEDILGYYIDEYGEENYVEFDNESDWNWWD